MKKPAITVTTAFLALVFSSADVLSQDVRDDVTETIETFTSEDPGIAEWFETAHGYAVYPNVGKGGFIVGGGHGTGQVFRDGSLIGESEVSMLSVGLQVGGQEYSQVVFFQNADALARLIKEEMEFGAGVSAVAVDRGMSANASYRNGIAVFTRTKGGAMAEASLNGQKFSYKSYE